MGRFNCARHGLQFVSQVCPHVDAAIAEGRPHHFAAIDHPYLSWLWLCVACACAADLAASKTDEVLEQFGHRITVVCGMCADEWRGSHVGPMPDVKS